MRLVVAYSRETLEMVFDAPAGHSGYFAARANAASMTT
jgi:hypothetical protein